jgi:hypothetical protein
MNYLEFLCTDSKHHKIIRKGAKTIQIVPLIENDQECLLAFQSVLVEAIENSFGCGYEVIHTHKTSMVPGDLYDSAVITWENINMDHL